VSYLRGRATASNWGVEFGLNKECDDFPENEPEMPVRVLAEVRPYSPVFHSVGKAGFTEYSARAEPAAGYFDGSVTAQRRLVRNTRGCGGGAASVTPTRR